MVGGMEWMQGDLRVYSSGSRIPMATTTNLKAYTRAA